MEEKENLTFVSRHEPNDGQVALVKELGYKGIKQISVTFGKNPVEDLKSAGIQEKTIGIVAPSHVTNMLLNAGYKLIEFVNSPIKREKTVFCCEGAYKFTLSVKIYDNVRPIQADAKIEQEYIPCPIPVNEQYESSLI